MVTGRHFTANRSAAELYYMQKCILNVQCYSGVAQTHTRMVKVCMDDAKAMSLNNVKHFEQRTNSRTKVQGVIADCHCGSSG
jgi:hypothetical protein